MKEIRMDYETYHKELRDREQIGVWRGLRSVCRWIKSGKPLWEYLHEGHVIDCDWRELAIALGREDELNKSPNSVTKEKIT